MENQWLSCCRRSRLRRTRRFRLPAAALFWVLWQTACMATNSGDLAEPMDAGSPPPAISLSVASYGPGPVYVYYYINPSRTLSNDSAERIAKAAFHRNGARLTSAEESRLDVRILLSMRPGSDGLTSVCAMLGALSAFTIPCPGPMTANTVDVLVGNEGRVYRRYRYSYESRLWFSWLLLFGFQFDSRADAVAEGLPGLVARLMRDLRRDGLLDGEVPERLFGRLVVLDDNTRYYYVSPRRDGAETVLTSSDGESVRVATDRIREMRWLAP